MNNHDYMKSLSDEELAEFLDINVDGCMTEMCAWYDAGNCRAGGGKGCKSGMLSWMREKHVEPDTPGRIAEELAEMAGKNLSGGGWACDYGHSFEPYDDCDCCSTCRLDRDRNCVEQVFRDLSKRLAALDEK